MVRHSTWALGGVERFAFVASLEKVRHIIVYGDNGRAADRPLAKARDYLTANGRELVNRVPEHHDDWNDAWRAYQASAEVEPRS